MPRAGRLRGRWRAAPWHQLRPCVRRGSALLLGKLLRDAVYFSDPEDVDCSPPQHHVSGSPLGIVSALLHQRGCTLGLGPQLPDRPGRGWLGPTGWEPKSLQLREVAHGGCAHSEDLTFLLRVDLVKIRTTLRTPGTVPTSTGRAAWKLWPPAPRSQSPNLPPSVSWGPSRSR